MTIRFCRIIFGGLIFPVILVVELKSVRLKTPQVLTR